MDGILLVDKPKGWTSFDVVAKVRGILKQSASHQSSVTSQKELATIDKRQVTPSRKVKVGHTGTLDPLATGLLVLLVGKYTKRAPELSKLDKTYEVTMRLGEVSTTGDDEGEKTAVSDAVPSLEQVHESLGGFEGEIEQVPPIYSAIKINGQRAYKMARAGKEVKMEPRKVTVYSINLIGYSYPEAKFTVEVSSGTYIRSLVEDIGRELETGAYMNALLRTQVGKYVISRASQIEDLNSGNILNRLIES